jgi:cell division protein ZapA (FtsZ GTPase activity inhibitor)
MGSLAIKIVIAGRTYPLTIEMDEEENLQKAARNIEDSINFFQESYAVKDKQDLLAMTALQLATQLLVQQQQSALEQETKQLSDLDATLSAYLESNQL